jgi:hypothetical protein
MRSPRPFTHEPGRCRRAPAVRCPRDARQPFAVRATRALLDDGQGRRALGREGAAAASVARGLEAEGWAGQHPRRPET